MYGVAGPMGMPSHVTGVRKAAVVGGGLGVAPIFPQARALKEQGAYVIGVIGFRTRELVFWEEKFRSCCDELVICTDDGSAGIKGRVTAGLERTMEAHPDLDQVIAIGPPVMMQACAEATRAAMIKTLVSLNPVMVDGTGMCGGCRVTIGSKVKFACVDGPDFDGHEVDFDDLMVRLRRYAADEKKALARWQGQCRMQHQD
jgi:NAD(P)H-flavin reductase